MSEALFQPAEGRRPEGPALGTGSTSRKGVSSEQLMGGAREIAIHHRGQEYRLQVTRNGKLILTK